MKTPKADSKRTCCEGEAEYRLNFACFSEEQFDELISLFNIRTKNSKIHFRNGSFRYGKTSHNLYLSDWDPRSTNGFSYTCFKSSVM